MLNQDPLMVSNPMIEFYLLEQVHFWVVFTVIGICFFDNHFS